MFNVLIDKYDDLEFLITLYGKFITRFSQHKQVKCIRWCAIRLMYLASIASRIC